MIDTIKNIIRRLRIQLLHLKTCSCTQLNILKGDTLIIAPHPDDETLGCGGLIQTLCQQGTPPHVVILTGGGKSHSSCCHINESLLKKARRKLSSEILTKLGITPDQIHFLDFPDGSISPQHPEMSQLEKLLTQLSPNTIFIPHRGEGWSDHLVVRELIKNIHFISSPTIYEYCVWVWYYNFWSLDWSNAFLLPLTKEQFTKKRETVLQYVQTQAPCGSPWSGILPKILIDACLWNKELYFKIK